MRLFFLTAKMGVIRSKLGLPLDQLQSYGRVGGPILAIIVLVGFTSVLINTDVTPLGVMTGSRLQGQMSMAENQETDTTNDSAVQALIAELQAATSRARGKDSRGVLFNKALWNQENPCLSRAELPQKYSRRKFVGQVKPNLPWRAVLREYAKLHRTCMHRVGNATGYFLSRRRSVDCRFTIVDTDRIGIGNRFLVMASAVMYSVLTQRVILLAGDEDFIPSELLCEPFEGSSWRKFDVGRKVTPYDGDPNDWWTSSNTFHTHVDGALKEGKVYQDRDHYAVANINVKNWYGQPLSRFYCDEEQKHYKNITFLYLTGMIYSLPKLFTVPTFRPVLEALFPDRMALTAVLHEVLLPADEVWARVKRMDHGYLENNDRRLGIQLRYRLGSGEYNSMHEKVAIRVMQCAIENNLLPPVANVINGELPSPVTTQPHKITVFLASLYEGVKSNLTETFLRHPTVNGDTVEVVQLSSEGDQKFGKEIFQAALAEILILSFSDFLFVTPKSTFSGMAQAYGGVVPWFIDWRDNITNSGPCTRAQTVDVCFQVPFDYNVKCPFDPDRNDKPIRELYPDIQNCLDVDCGGLQLITHNDLSMEDSL